MARQFLSKHLFEILDFFFARQIIFEADFWPAKPFMLKILPIWSKGWPPLAYTINSQPGVRVPPRVHKQFSGGAWNFKSYQNRRTKDKQNGFWGYAKGFNIDLGVLE